MLDFKMLRNKENLKSLTIKEHLLKMKEVGIVLKTNTEINNLKIKKQILCFIKMLKFPLYTVTFVKKTLKLLSTQLMAFSNMEVELLLD